MTGSRHAHHEALQRHVLGQTLLDLADLGTAGTHAALERAEERRFPGLFEAGGALVFPHIRVADCADQVAACVHTCLDSGADVVVVLGVLHPLGELAAARDRVAAGLPLSDEPCRGIQGPGLEGRDDWRRDHSLLQWRHFWEAEIERRGLAASDVPRMVERYPFLAAADPASLPGIEELADLADGAALVATADPMHHGVAYGTPADDAMEPDEAGMAMAGRLIEDGIDILTSGDYDAYDRHCEAVQSDAANALELLHLLRAPTHGRIVDLASSDTAYLYDEQSPSWVAGALIEWHG